MISDIVIIGERPDCRTGETVELCNWQIVELGNL